MPSSLPKAAVLFAVLVLAACAPAASPGAARPSANLITRAEIDEAGPSSAYDLVQKLRPIWLRKRGNTSLSQDTDVVVYLDGVRMGNREALRDISTTDIRSLEFMDARRATARFGEGHVAGAILVRTRG
ncbi:MAG: hypothetical protein PVJ02_11140 [Gemmatimonadota bacterium]|jgi:hypothetical protein